MRMAAVRAEPPLARHCPTAQARRRGEIAPGRLRLVREIAGSVSYQTHWTWLLSRYYWRKTGMVAPA
jgi:hypothetical protein